MARLIRIPASVQPAFLLPAGETPEQYSQRLDELAELLAATTDTETSDA